MTEFAEPTQATESTEPVAKPSPEVVEDVESDTRAQGGARQGGAGAPLGLALLAIVFLTRRRTKRP